jgi:hypothetical protein
MGCNCTKETILINSQKFVIHQKIADGLVKDLNCK